MTKRNFILLIILITIILLVIAVSFLGNDGKILNPETNEEISLTENDKPGFLANFLPFGKNKNNENNTQNTNEIIQEEFIDLDKVQLAKISSLPISGYGIFLKERFSFVPTVVPGENTSTGEVIPVAPPTELVSVLRYAAKSTGNIYQTFIDETEERKVTESIIPKLVETYFGDGGESVIMRYIKNDGQTIMTFAGKIPGDILGGDSSENTVAGSFLPENIIDMAVSPLSDKIFYLSKIGNNVLGTTSSPLGIQKIQIFDSAYTEWLTGWPNENVITLTTKASSFSPGFMYTLNPNSTEFKKILGNINGLTTLTSPNGNLVLYGNNKMDMFVYNQNTNRVTKLKTKTLPEKCVWANDSLKIYCFVPQEIITASYPDSWYQGEISFSDTIWGIDTQTGDELSIVIPENIGVLEEFDGIKPTLDQENNNLFFINKKDSYLWRLKLN